jgi:hypothetical protein
MPRYRFDLRYDDEPWSEDDTKGMNLRSAAEARRDAVRLVADIAKDEALRHRKIVVRVRDGSPEPVVTVILSVELQPPD